MEWVVKGGVKVLLVLVLVSLVFAYFVLDLWESSKTDDLYVCPDCNIVLISIDTLRADHVGCYGYVRDTTPKLDGFAEKSVFFKNAYTPWPTTSPSFASFFTGMHPFNTGIERLTQQQRLDDDLVLLAEVLGDAGYHTRGVTANPLLSKKLNINQGFLEYNDSFKWNELKADELTIMAIKDLFELKEGKFLYWVHYMDPHAPYAPPAEYKNIFVGDRYYDSGRLVPTCDEGVDSLNLVEDDGETGYEIARRRHINNPDVGCSKRSGLLDDYIARYDGEVRFTDENIGFLLDEIENFGLLENSIVVIWSDHGESLGDNGYYFFHGRLPYNSCLKVPLMIYLPKQKGKEVGTTVSLIDVYPTLLSMLGLEYESDGEDIRGLIAGGDRERIVFSSAGYAIDYQKIAADGHWKMVYVPDYIDRLVMKNSSYELYDLMADPAELDNLYGKEVDGMYLKEYLDGFLEKDFKRKKTEFEGVEYDEETVRILRSLGYLV